MPCLVTFIPDIESKPDDWRVELTQGINEQLRQDSNIHHMFNLALPYVFAETGETAIPAQMMGLSSAQTDSKVYLMVPEFGSISEYDYTLDD